MMHALGLVTNQEDPDVRVRTLFIVTVLFALYLQISELVADEPGPLVVTQRDRSPSRTKVSTTMDTSFCIEALEEAIEKHGCPEIFNTDKGSQITSNEFTQVLKDNDIKISMDGKGRWVDNVFVERPWRSVKYEEIYLQAYDTVADARQSIGRYFEFYNTKRRHQSLGKQTPDSVYTQVAARKVA